MCLQMQNGGEVDTQQVDQLLTEKADLQVQLKQVSIGVHSSFSSTRDLT